MSEHDRDHERARSRRHAHGHGHAVDRHGGGVPGRESASGALPAGPNGPYRGSLFSGAVVVSAPTEPLALVRYARHVGAHLHETPEQLVPYARALDTQLRAGAFDPRPDDVIAVVDALLAIRAELGGRPPAELATFRTSSSPLDGMIEDITPFGNVDAWHALRSAARERRDAERERRRSETHGGTGDTGGTGGGGPTPTPNPTDDGSTIGVHGGTVSSLRAGDAIADGIGRDVDHMAGDWSTALDNGSLAYDTITTFIEVAQIAEIAGQAVQPLISTISLLLTMEASWQQTQNGLRAWGMRCALVALDTPFAPYPLTLHTRELEEHILNSTASATWERNVLHASAYEAGDSGEPAALGRVGVAEVASRVNEAVRTAEAWPALARELAAAPPELRDRIRQDLRRAMYHRIYEAAAERLTGD